jgi:hypothetical protein
VPDLSSTLDLLQRHHRSNRPVMNRGTPSSAEWHSLWGRLREIREASAAGDASCRDWLAIHGPMIQAVEACRAHDLKEAVTYRGPGRR